MELEGIPSIWDGWEHQLIGVRCSRLREGNCALGWVDRTLYGDQWLTAEQPVADYLPEIAAVYHRVAEHIKKHFLIPALLQDHDAAIIAYANNRLGFTPDDFRRIDRLTQYEEGMRQIEQQIKEGRHDVSEVSA